MKSQLVFQGEIEMERLEVQSRLLLPYEAPIFQRIFSGRSNLKLLDIGCNDGRKTVKWFSSPAVSKVIGLEYNADLSEKAQKMYGGEKFSFYSCDVEASDFSDRLSERMRQNGVECFDVIYLSFVLMHLNSPQELLRQLRGFLAEDGCLVVLEANDRASVLTPDSDGLLGEFLDILEQDPLAGKRRSSNTLGDLLMECGYRNIRAEYEGILARENETDIKQDIIQTFFSFLAEDVAILRSQFPENARYTKWADWLDAKYDRLKQAILREDSTFLMGMRLLTCTG